VVTSGTDVVDERGHTVGTPRVKIKNTGITATPSGLAF
jgi:hypothetical protein